MILGRLCVHVIRCIFRVQLYSLGSLVVGQLSWQISILLVENLLHMTEFDLLLLVYRANALPIPMKSLIFFECPVCFGLFHVALFQAAVCEGGDSGRPGRTRQIQAGAGADAE